jgi:GAF domain-containing protein
MHEYRLSGVPRVGDAPLPEIEQVLERNDVVAAPAGASAPGVRSALAVPIRLRDQIIGVIDVHETESDRAWTPDDVALVTAVADQTAQALENARLFEQTQQRARREQLVTQIATRVRAAQDVEGILRAGVHEIRRVLGASHGLVRLNTEAPAPKFGETRPTSADSPAAGSEAVAR